MKIELFKLSVENWLKKLKPSTASPYMYGLYRYCEFTKLDPDELIKEARQDYIDRVPPWEIRSAKHFEDFVQHLKKENVPNLTALTYLYGVKIFISITKFLYQKLRSISLYRIQKSTEILIL